MQSSYSAQTTYFEMVLRPKCQLSGKKKAKTKHHTQSNRQKTKQNKTKFKKNKQTKSKQVTRVEFEDSKL